MIYKGKKKFEMVRAAGVEPTTIGFGDTTDKFKIISDASTIPLR
jgi:hypothetical protein